MTRRINARLDDDLARKVDALRKRTGQSTTDILRASLESYYVTVTRDAGPAAGLAAFVGCADGPADLSEDYKSKLTAAWNRKVR